MDEPLYDELHGDAPDPGVGAGRLVALPDGDRELVLPLRGTEVKASVAIPCAEVRVTQRFANDRDRPLECIYIFPLPSGAAVTSLTFTVGDRQLRAELKERGAAERDYEAARDSGRRASLLTAERADVFTTRVANIQPGEEVRVELTLAWTLPFDDGGFVFRFPLVLGDRYIPGMPDEGEPTGHGAAPDTDQVPDASRISPPRLLPGVRPAHDLSVDVELLPGGLSVTDLVCSQHATALSFGDGRLQVGLARNDELPNRDFILRFRFAGDRPEGVLWTAETDDGVRFLATLVPPADIPAGGPVPREVVLLVDVSGSMMGPKMPAAIEAARLVLRGLGEGDALQLVAFSSRHRKLWRAPKAAVQSTIDEADRFLRGLTAGGGTEMLSPLRDVLRKPPTAGRVRHVVLITDGQVGNEASIVREVSSLDQPLRVFAVGIDTAVNEAFCESLARETRGLACLMTPSDPIAERMTRFLATVGSPVAVDAELVGMDVSELFPGRLPDLYQGRPVVVSGLLSEAPTGASVRLSLPDGTRTEVSLGAPRSGGDAVVKAVGRARVAELEQRWQLFHQAEDRKALLTASLDEQVLSVLTGLVVVDDRPTDGGEAASTVIPVMAPAGWEMYDDAPMSVGGYSACAPPMPFPMASAPASRAPGRSRRVMAKRSASPPSAIAGALGSVRSIRDEDVDCCASPMDDLACFDEADAEFEPEEAKASAPPASLSALVLDQRFDGSFPAVGDDTVLEATAAALLRLVQAGNTDLRGPHRKAVAKAATFLLGALAKLDAQDAARAPMIEALTAWARATGTDAARERLEAVI
jgi:Ca-activated chloride channel family protein